MSGMKSYQRSANVKTIGFSRAFLILMPTMLKMPKMPKILKMLKMAKWAKMPKKLKMPKIAKMLKIPQVKVLKMPQMSKMANLQGLSKYLCGSHGISARRARRTESRGLEGLQLEVRA